MDLEEMWSGFAFCPSMFLVPEILVFKLVGRAQIQQI
jgi:hypothetical protein